MTGWRRQSSLASDSGEARDLAAAASSPFAPLSFDRIFDDYWEALFRYCYLRLGSWEDAEDAAQNVLVSVSRRLSGFTERSGSGGFRSWVFTIAHNETVDQHRKRGRRAESPLSDIRPAADPGPTPEDAAAASWEHRWLRDHLARLSPDQRAVLELRLADLTGREVAAVLGLSHDNVRKLQARAELKLRVLAAERGGGRHAG